MDIQILRDFKYQGVDYGDGLYTAARGNVLSNAADLVAQGYAIDLTPKFPNAPATTTTDASGNPVISQGNFNFKRKALADLFDMGPLVPAKAWTANEVVTAGMVRVTSLGKFIEVQTGGTCGTVEPVFGGVSRVTASVSGTTTLTVTAVVGDPIGIGTEFISGGTTSGTKISALGTGTGGAGTYTLSGNAVATIASTDMGAMTNSIGRRVTEISTNITAGSFAIGQSYTIVSAGTTDFTLIGAANSITGTIFTATGVGSGTGTASTNTRAIWDLTYQWKKVNTEANYPIVTWETGANTNAIVSALGMVRYPNDVVGNFNTGEPLVNIAPKAGIGGVTPFKCVGFDYRLQSTSSAYDSFAAAYGYPIGMWKSESFEYVTYITDSCFAFEVNSFATVPAICVEADGRIIETSPTRTNNGNSQLIKFDFRGDFRERKVSIRLNHIDDSIQSVILTPLGSVRAGKPSTDTLLCLGDSIWNTFSPGGQGLYNNIPFTVQKKLGFEACVCANAGGTGYVATGGFFTLPQMVSDSTNQTLFKSYNINHVIICAGLNDNSGTFPSATPALITAAALQTYQTLRQLLPNAKITIFDQWSTTTVNNSALVGQAILAAFNQWGDSNSRFCSFNGLTGFAPLMSYNGITGNITTPLTNGAGAKTLFLGNDGTHPEYGAANYYGQFIVDQVKQAWGNNY